MIDREKVITHLQIIHTWAEFARERDLQFFTAKHLEDIAQWAEDALAILKEQEEQIDTQRRNLMILLNEPRIVRCKDCEHATITTDGEYCKYCENYTDENGDPIEVYHSANWFCADGRKRDE